VCHSGARAKPASPESKTTILSSDLIIEIIPIRIVLLNQIDFPLPPPPLQFFLAFDGSRRIVISFIPYKEASIVMRREALDELVLVLMADG
jgi:hypothetical protein